MKSTRTNMLKNLRNRLLLINLISLTLVITVAFSIIYINFYNRAQSEIEKTLSAVPRGVNENFMFSSVDGRMILTPGETIGVTGVTLRGASRLPADYSKSFVVNIGPDEATIFSMLDIDLDEYTAAIEVVLANDDVAGEVDIAAHTWRYSLEPSLSPFSPYSHSIVFLDIEDDKRSLAALAASLFVIGIIAVGVILLVSLMLANRAIRPVEESIARQRRFIADASHELKTPIAVIAANAEAMPGQSQWTENIAAEADRMSALVENLLDLARADEKPAENTSFDLAEAVREEAERVEAFLFEKDVTFEIDAQDAIINTDRKKLQTILSILLENAVKYTSEGGRVTLKITKEKVSVANTGPYIPPEDIAHIFDRFFRADPSRNSDTGGHGIGLSIASEMARSLGLTLSAASAPRSDGGAINTFTLSL